MEGVKLSSVALQYVADRLVSDRFTLIDVGCSGGIDPIWRAFGLRLTAFGFDPNLNECERLNGLETLSSVKYVAGFAGLPKDDPIMKRRGERQNVSRMLAEQATHITDAPVNVDLDLVDLANAGLLVFRSWSPNGESTRARILSIETIQRNESQEQVPSGPGTILPLDYLQPQNGGELSTRDGYVVLATPRQQWAYAASAILPPKRATGPGVVRVRLQVEQGELGVGVLACDYVERDLARRLSYQRTLQIRQVRNPRRPAEELVAENQWSKVSQADPSTPIVLPRFFRENSINDIDMIKIDVDGADFDILQSLSDTLTRCKVLAVGLEVNFVGSADDTDHTFANTDRFMRAHGFDLFYLTVRPYSVTALPSSYQLPVPGQTKYGRPVQGDAVYARDLGQSSHPDLVGSFGPAKLAKLAAIFTAIGLVDSAAEVLVTHRDSLSVFLDVDKVLDLLCREAQETNGRRQVPLSYRDYMAAFERDDPMFYPLESSDPRSALTHVSFMSFKIARVLSVATMNLCSRGSSLRRGASGVRFRSAPLPWVPIARMPLLTGCFDSGGWVAADIKMTLGTVSIGVLNLKGDDYLVSAPVEPANEVQTVYLRVDSFAAAGDLIVRNWDEESASEGVLKAVRIVSDNGQSATASDVDPGRSEAIAMACPQPLAALSLGSPGSILRRSVSGVEFRSPALPWAHIGRMPLDLAGAGGGGWVAVDIRLRFGSVGVGVLNLVSDAFVVSALVVPSDDVQTVFLRVDSFAMVGDFIVRNWDEESSSEGVLEAVRIASDDGLRPKSSDLGGSDPQPSAT